ncbi:winged helix-turn-helix transcriptional regulator [Hyphomicrobium sp. CS1GBMeth3]|uniref:winged helix-turn-helix transcriptional regulator n=1 Tax=Hyphomicrobium sp. CS1GBMeth3 TaxID=1892845 RepID=UPI0009310089|nr:winged helix-turn-helix transcriptional regulator [Hyphomicrobium sp. CS1GBMeth3]
MPDKASIQTELDLIAALERGDVISQSALSKRLEVSVGLVNALLRRVIRKGLVKTRKAPYRRWAYYLTPKGLAEKSRLVAKYLEASLGFFRKARDEYGQIFMALRRAGVDRAVLVGRGELAEIALLAAREHEIRIVGLLDAEMNEGSFLGIPVLRGLHDIDRTAGLVITASRHPQEAYDRLMGASAERIIHAPPLLRVVVAPQERGAKASNGSDV